MKDMVRAYVEEIRDARSAGPVVIGGMGDGSLAAIEVARELVKIGQQVGPVILTDPPVAPGTRRVPSELGPEAKRQLYERVRQNLLSYASLSENDLPFDSRDPQQLHRAALSGVGSMLAFGRHVPTPFPGPAQLILCAKLAADFFHPQMPWHKLLSGPRMVHILPWDQVGLFRAGCEHVARGLKFLLGEASTLQIVSANQELDAPAIERSAQGIDALVSRAVK
jgi:thioesterase domain-containing protein